MTGPSAAGLRSWLPPWASPTTGLRSWLPSWASPTTGQRSWLPTRTGPNAARQRSDVLSSAAVIVAGVLLVVGFAVIASRSTKSDTDGSASLPPAGFPGGLPSADGGPSPIEPAPTDSPSPSDSLTPTRTTKPPDHGSISIETENVPSRVVLSAEGTRDWVHWGEGGTFSLERRAGGNFAILEGTPSAPRFRHALSPERFAWTGGAPVDHSDGTPTGIRTCGAGNGFTLTAPAGTTTRELRLYLGVVAARGRIEARLTTGSVTRTATLEQRAATFRSALYTIRYRAPKTSKISLNWLTKESFSTDCGGVALQAATLR